MRVSRKNQSFTYKTEQAALSLRPSRPVVAGPMTSAKVQDVANGVKIRPLKSLNLIWEK